jgi:hypothetical protein
MCELVHGTKNVIVALPSGLVSAWLNAARITEMTSELFAPSGSQLSLPEAGMSDQVGTVVEDRPDFAWQTFEEFTQRFLQPAA